MARGRYNKQKSELCLLFPERITRPAKRNAALLRLGSDVGSTFTEAVPIANRLFAETVDALATCALQGKRCTEGS
jgi:hypothetical protein